MKSTLPLALWLLLLAPARAGAWPVDAVWDLKPGEDRFQRFSSLSWVEVEDPSIVTAEALPSAELMLTAKAPGRTLVLLYAEGKFAVWRVRVGGTSPAAQVASKDAALSARVEKACGKVKVPEPGGERTWSLNVSSEGCRLALRSLFETDAFRARDVDLTFDATVLQAQLKDIARGLEPIAPKVQASYLGAGLVLQGEVTEAQHRAVLWQVFRRAVGRVALDDSLHAPEPVSKEPQGP